MDTSHGPRLGSLCTGYGGLDMAVRHVIGGHLAWVADNDPGASRILTHHHPNVPNLGDITTTDWTAVPPVDVVLGGYPCQPFSTAGKRKGAEDARHIWPHIADALGVLRPRLAVFENVAGHLSLGFDTVLADLAALGFDARWGTVRASDVGAAHQRNRLFLCAWPADPVGEGRQGTGLPGWPPGCRLAAAHPLDVGGDWGRACGAGRDESPARRLAPPHTAGACERELAERARPLTESRNARQKPGRGSLLPAPDPDPDPDVGGQRAEQRDVRAGESDLAWSAAADTAIVGRGEGRTEPAGRQGGSDVAVTGAPHWGEFGSAILRWESAIGRTAPGPTDPVGRLSPAFVEWLMGLPAGHVTDVPGLSRTAQLKALGNGVVPQQAAHAIRTLLASTAADHTTAAA